MSGALHWLYGLRELEGVDGAIKNKHIWQRMLFGLLGGVIAEEDIIGAMHPLQRLGQVSQESCLVRRLPGL